jgi:hypothetical protein
MSLALGRNRIQTFKVLLRHFLGQFFVSESIPASLFLSVPTDTRQRSSCWRFLRPLA